MSRFTICYSLPWDMIKIIFDKFRDEVDDSLYLLACSECLILAKSKQMDDSLGEDDLTYFKVNLFIFKYLDLLNPSSNTHILKDVYSDVDDCWFTRLIWHVYLLNITLKFINRPITLIIHHEPTPPSPSELLRFIWIPPCTQDILSLLLPITKYILYGKSACRK